MKIIWLLFAWNPQAHMMQPVMWFPAEAACRAQERAEAERRWQVQAPVCGAVSQARWDPEAKTFR